MKKTSYRTNSSISGLGLLALLQSFTSISNSNSVSIFIFLTLYLFDYQ